MSQGKGIDAELKAKLRFYNHNSLDKQTFGFSLDGAATANMSNIENMKPPVSSLQIKIDYQKNLDKAIIGLTMGTGLFLYDPANPEVKTDQFGETYEVNSEIVVGFGIEVKFK